MKLSELFGVIEPTHKIYLKQENGEEIPYFTTILESKLAKYANADVSGIGATDDRNIWITIRQGENG